MTLSSRHRIWNSSPGGLRPSTLPLGHGGSPQYWLSHVDGEETFFVFFKPPRLGTELRTLAWKAAVLTTTLGPPPKGLPEASHLTHGTSAVYQHSPMNNVFAWSLSHHSWDECCIFPYHSQMNTFCISYCFRFIQDYSTNWLSKHSQMVYLSHTPL